MNPEQQALLEEIVPNYELNLSSVSDSFHHESTVAALLDALAEARKDAERYRHIRKQIDVDIAVMEQDEDGDPMFIRSYPPELLDAYLDQAMKGGE